MIAVKSNRQYTITEAQQKEYQRDGFDIKDDKGNIIQHGAGKMISYERHEAEVALLRSEIAKLTEKCDTLAKSK